MRLRRSQRNAKPRRRATPQIGPTTAPAIAAPEILWFDTDVGDVLFVVEFVIVVPEPGGMGVVGGITFEIVADVISNERVIASFKRLT